MVMPNWIVGIEYKHLGFGRETYTFTFPFAGGSPVSGTANLDIDEVTLRARWKY